jgi:SAM-dependent methyltransferase
MNDAVMWHDLECGGYSADLPLWRRLVADTDGDVLDVGAGTGRVALDLARRGVRVTALDSEEELLQALTARALAAGLEIETVVADARTFSLRRSFAAVLVPMQTIQLLGGATGRKAFLQSALAHLAPGGFLAVALADALEGFDEEHSEPPLPDIREVDGVVFASRPVAVREHALSVSIERIREVVGPHGERSVSGNIIHLDRLEAPALAAEGLQAGYASASRDEVAATDEYVGSAVVILHV